MKYEAVVFDLDGTLIDSATDLGNAVNRVLVAHGFQIHEIPKYRMFIGDGAETMVKRALPESGRDDQTIKQCLAEFLEDYYQNFDVDTVLYDGIPDLLDSLTEKSIKLSILTNKPYEIAIKFLDSILSHWDFDIVVGQKNALPKKPDPTGAFIVSEKLGVLTEKIVYLGDSGIDMKTAVSAGMLPIGVLWGFRSRDELIDNGAKYLINKPLEINNLIAF
ncbi:MAG: HAD family hydrolase [Thermodesulfobacteriota bacterium]